MIENEIVRRHSLSHGVACVKLSDESKNRQITLVRTEFFFSFFHFSCILRILEFEGRPALGGWTIPKGAPFGK